MKELLKLNVSPMMNADTAVKKQYLLMHTQ